MQYNEGASLICPKENMSRRRPLWGYYRVWIHIRKVRGCDIELYIKKSFIGSPYYAQAFDAELVKRFRCMASDFFKEHPDFNSCSIKGDIQYQPSTDCHIQVGMWGFNASNKDWRDYCKLYSV
ncbi:hypothetical protein NIES2101_23925 [Calothrix sp. HK-06]|nr:hypothetical protein NIES2101_23790 [Calothrix sp. HK-06]OKH47316.1 hypothetical protein NIES2101_23925 [Calothrix sp. HK-06]